MKELVIYPSVEEALAVHGFAPDDGAEGEDIMDTMRMHAGHVGVNIGENVLASLAVASMDDQDTAGWRALIRAAGEGKKIAFDDEGNFTIDGEAYDRDTKASA